MLLSKKYNRDEEKNDNLKRGESFKHSSKSSFTVILACLCVKTVRLAPPEVSCGLARNSSSKTPCLAFLALHSRRLAHRRCRILSKSSAPSARPRLGPRVLCVSTDDGRARRRIGALLASYPKGCSPEWKGKKVPALSAELRPACVCSGLSVVRVSLPLCELAPPPCLQTSLHFRVSSHTKTVLSHENAHS